MKSYNRNDSLIAVLLSNTVIFTTFSERENRSLTKKRILARFYSNYVYVVVANGEGKRNFLFFRCPQLELEKKRKVKRYCGMSVKCA